MTDNPRPHVRAAHAATAAAVVLLAFLFLFPRQHIQTLHALLLPYAERSTEAVVAEDWERARSETQAMYELYLPYDKSLRLYMDHQEVDALHMRLLSCKNLARAEDEQIIVDLEELKGKLLYLESVETLNLWNLL